MVGHTRDRVHFEAIRATIAVEHKVASYFKAKSGGFWKFMRFFCAWLVLFGVSYGIKVGAHIGIDVVVRQFAYPLRRAVGLIAVLCCCAYCIILLVGATGYVHKLYSIGIEAQDLPIPRWVPFIMLPVGLALALLRLLQVAWHTVHGRQEGLRLADEAREAIEAVESVETVEAIEVLHPEHPSAPINREEKAP